MKREDYLSTLNLPQKAAFDLSGLLFDDTDTIGESDLQELFEAIESTGRFSSEVSVIQCNEDGKNCYIASYIPAVGYISESLDKYYLPLERFKEIIAGFRNCEEFADA